MPEKKKKWMSSMHLEKGALRRTLHVKSGHDIPASKLAKAEHSKNPTTRKRAVLAETFKKARKK